MTQANDFDFFYDLALDEKDSKEGKWFEYRPGFKFLIANADTREFRLTAAKGWKTYMEGQKAKGQPDTLTAYSEEDQSKIAMEVTINAVVEALLLGWEGQIPFKGQKLEYSKENAKQLLSVESFRGWVDKISNEPSNFRVARPTEEDVKN